MHKMAFHMADPLELRILICAPFGKDAELAGQVIEGSGIACFICKSVPALLQELDKGAAAVLAAEEALPEQAMGLFANFFMRQPAWSDLPVLVLTKCGGESPWIAGAYERLGNLTLLERPVRSSTLVSAVRSALRARLRQYEVRRADQRKDEFLAMLAHELRNPLAPISAAADLLNLVSSDKEKIEQVAAIIARQVRHMAGLVDDLLDVARVTRGLITLQKEPLDMRHILREALEQVIPQVRLRRHKLELHMPPGPAQVQGDRKRLIQIVANILGNAAKYTQDEGSIAVRLQVDADEVVLVIADNGSGIAPELMPRVFELFTQAERTLDRAQGGLGLGLALVKSLAVSHGGTVHAYSKGLNEGSTFTLRLPRLVTQIQACSAAGQAMARRSAVDHGQPLRILVVDDNIDAANMLEMFLVTSGHVVLVECMARAAIKRARSTSPQVCFLDIGLPDMDGYELARQLRSMPETAQAVLIALTGYTHEQHKEKSLAAGFDHYFVKPVEAAQLVNVLSRIDKT